MGRWVGGNKGRVGGRAGRRTGGKGERRRKRGRQRGVKGRGGRSGGIPARPNSVEWHVKTQGRRANCICTRACSFDSGESVLDSGESVLDS